MAKSIIITVRRGGKIQTTAEGIKGEACEPLVAGLAAKLGGQQTAAEHTEEFYQAPEATADAERQAGG